MKKRIGLLAFTLCIVLIITGVAIAGVEEKVKEAVPESWFEAPKTASELGINQFNQSPVMEEKVASGELPPVEERLPSDPPVIEPIDRIGDYGGTHILFDTEVTARLDADLIGYRTHFFIPDPLRRKMKPHLAKDFEFSNEAKECTIYLREGMNWSDGHPFTADDIMYWWEAHANNRNLKPTPPEDWSPIGWEKVEKIDEYTVKIYFKESNPLFIQNFKTNPLGEIVGFFGGFVSIPAHYLKQFHLEYTEDKEQLQNLVEEKGFEEWYQLYSYIGEGGHPEFPVPSFKPYVIEERGASSSLYVRNPYFPFVDPEGNQLPYIEKVRNKKIHDWEMYNAKVVTGEATFAYCRASIRNLPLFKKGESKENYRVILGERPHSAQVKYMPNLNHDDPDIREILQNKKFRRALSYGINREEISQTFFFGTAEPSAVTVHPSHPYYEESYQKYIEYNPEKAKELLDNIGVKDTDGDGWRELPNGDNLNLTVEYTSYEGMIPKFVEMVNAHWKELGLNISSKQLSWGLWIERANASKMDMTIFAHWIVSPLSFPHDIASSSNYVPLITHYFHASHWMKWARWNETGGEAGVEPPENIKELINKYKLSRKTTDDTEREKLGKQILEENAEKVWTIGTVGRWTKPMIVNDNLKNVPEFFIHAGSHIEYYPFTMFFEDGEAKK